MVVVNLILLATLLIVVILEGFNWFAIWTAIPLLAVAVFAEFSLSSTDGNWNRLAPTRRFGLMGLVGGVVALTLYSHLALFFEVASDAADEPSARLLQYMLASVYAIGGGAVGYAMGFFFGRRLEQGP